MTLSKRTQVPRSFRTSSSCKSVTVRLDIVPEWTQTGQTEDGFAINRYFLDHPEMVLGRQEPESTAHGMDYTVNPIEGLELADQLHDAVKYIRGTYQEAELPELGEGEAIDTSIPADPKCEKLLLHRCGRRCVLP